MRYDLIDSNGTQAVRLGVRREDLHRLLGRSREFRRTAGAKLSDQFVDAGVMVTYGRDGRAELIEFASPAEVFLASVQLIGEPLERIAKTLSARGIDLTRTATDEARISTWQVVLFVEEDRISGVAVGQ